MIEVSIIVLNYNTFALTSNCIRSVIEQTKNVEYEIILVDNASSECNADLFLEEFPQVKLIKNSLNDGFAKGNNKGLEIAKGNYLLLLNSDTVLFEDTISKTADYFSRLGRAGALGCKMIYPDGRVQHTARHFRSIKWELLDLFRFILYLLPYRKRAMLMLGKYFKSDFNCNCDWVNGAFFFFSKEILKHFPAGKLDERFFMYAEDQLWCWQFSQLGYKNYFYSETSIVHINNASTKLEKRLQLLKTMFNNELEIMRERKGNGLYYLIFVLIYGTKEWVRFFVKSLVLRITGKMMR